MRWMILAAALTLSSCSFQQKDASPYHALVASDNLGPSGDAVFEQVEGHARCAGFHRASADLATGTKSKVDFFTAVADDAETAAIQLASAKISKDLASDMVDQMAKTHAARWSYLIAADAKSDAVKRQATTCFDLAGEQEEIIREVVKTKYGFDAG